MLGYVKESREKEDSEDEKRNEAEKEGRSVPILGTSRQAFLIVVYRSLQVVLDDTFHSL